MSDDNRQPPEASPPTDTDSTATPDSAPPTDPASSQDSGAPAESANPSDAAVPQVEKSESPEPAESPETPDQAESDDPAESAAQAESGEPSTGQDRPIQPDTPEPADPTQPPAMPQRWLVVQASAALQAVAATNYACFGGRPVPHYGELMPEPPQLPGLEPGTLCAEVFIRAPDQSLRFAELDARFKPLEESGRQVVWQWYDQNRRLHVFWVWDFFRLQSHVVLRAGLPAPDADPGTAWATTIAAVRAILPGDTLTVKVQSACGNIHQPHPITAAAGDWSPG